MKKVGITIPPQYAEALLRQAAERGISADELAEKLIKNYLERSEENGRD